VQDALERALAAIAGDRVATVAAGRTDAGVHATMQVAHFDTTAERPDSAWVRGVNSHLPTAVAVQWARPVDAAFHARFAATGRHYTYVLVNHPVRPALLAGRVGWYHRPLDVTAMREGAAMLVGTHDFSAFRAAECQARTPVKTLRAVAIEASRGIMRFEFSADAYLHHMIRNIVGALLCVGTGKAAPAWIGELLAARDRTRGAATFAADGLYLVGVDYDPVWSLPASHRALVLPSPHFA
jgi:tRNA pseudouridine38-40 synthase